MPSLFTSLFRLIQSLFTSLFQLMPGLFSSLFQLIPSLFTSSFQLMPSLFTSLFQLMPSLFTSLFQLITPQPGGLNSPYLRCTLFWPKKLLFSIGFHIGLGEYGLCKDYRRQLYLCGVFCALGCKLMCVATI